MASIGMLPIKAFPCWVWFAPSLLSLPFPSIRIQRHLQLTKWGMERRLIYMYLRWYWLPHRMKQRCGCQGQGNVESRFVITKSIQNQTDRNFFCFLSPCYIYWDTFHDDVNRRFVVICFTMHDQRLGWLRDKVHKKSCPIIVGSQLDSYNIKRVPSFPINFINLFYEYPYYLEIKHYNIPSYPQTLWKTFIMFQYSLTKLSTQQHLTPVVYF